MKRKGKRREEKEREGKGRDREEEKKEKKKKEKKKKEKNACSPAGLYCEMRIEEAGSSGKSSNVWLEHSPSTSNIASGGQSITVHACSGKRTPGAKAESTSLLKLAVVLLFTAFVMLIYTS